MSLYDQVGGELVVTDVVARFYERVISDDMLSHWFKGSKPVELQRHLRTYLAVALDGPELYTGRSMREVHGGMRITNEAFDTMIARLLESLAESGVKSSVLTKVDARLGKLRAVIVDPLRA